MRKNSKTYPLSNFPLTFNAGLHLFSCIFICVFIDGMIFFCANLSMILKNELLKNDSLPHNLIKEKLIDLIKLSFQRKSLPFFVCNERNAFFTSKHQTRCKVW